MKMPYLPLFTPKKKKTVEKISTALSIVLLALSFNESSNIILQFYMV